MLGKTYQVRISTAGTERRREMIRESMGKLIERGVSLRADRAERAKRGGRRQGAAQMVDEDDDDAVSASSSSSTSTSSSSSSTDSGKRKKRGTHDEQHEQ